jgi:hypothetical protein
MDENFKKTLISLSLIVGVVLVLYYIMSPYQNCVREFDRLGRTNTLWCSANTRW